MLVWEITSPFCIFLFHWIHAIPIPNVAVTTWLAPVEERPPLTTLPISSTISEPLLVWRSNVIKLHQLSRKGWPICKACKLLQIADNHRNSRKKKTVQQGQDQLRLVISLHTSTNKHLLGSFIPNPFAKMSAWLGPSPLLPFPRDHFWCVKVSTCELFRVGKGQVNVRYCGHHNVSSCVIWHLVSPYFWENHGKSHQILTFYSAICSLKKFRGREFLPFFAVFVTISQHPRPPVDLVLAFLPLDHGHIGIGTALGIFLKNRGICQKCHHVTRTIIQIEKWNQVTNRDFFHSVKKWLWDA